jgi:long-chain acyl-CoA synthetase
MKGYWQRPKETEEALAGGWFHTGDIGEFSEDGYLRITDRLKDLIVTAAGKNIAPQPIEERIARSPFVEQVVVLGDKRKFPIMLVVPSFQAYRVALPGKIVKESDRHQYGDSRSLRELIESDIAPRIAGLARYERPKRTLIVTDTFSVSNGMLTPTLKIKRREIAARYADRIDQLYAEAEADAPRS